MSTCCSSNSLFRVPASSHPTSQPAPAPGYDAPRTKKGQFWFWVRFGATLGLLLIAATWLLHYQTAWANPEPGIQLSRNTGCTGVKPRAALSEDGAWLVAVWIEGDASSGQCRDSGKAVLRRAQRSGETYSWQEPQPVMDGQANANSACVTSMALQVRGGTAHLVTARRNPCLGENPISSIQYFTCELATGVCTAPESALSNTAVGQLIANAELYVDDGGAPHVVYSLSNLGVAGSGEVYYLRKIGGSWQEAPGSNLSTGMWLGSQYVDPPAYAPRVAGSGNRLHVVWDAHAPSSGGIPIYRYCRIDDGICPAEGGPKQINPQWEGDMGTYSLPIVAARGNRVLTIWHYCSEDPYAGPTCDRFQLIYSRSDDNGDNFTAPQVSEDAVGGAYPYDPGAGFPSTDAGTAAYNNQLQPSLALDTSGRPWVAWHAANNSASTAYMITTTIATGETGLTFNWAHQPGWSLGVNNLDRARVNPVLLIPYQPTTPSAHLIYMAKNASGGHYQIYYTTLQEAETPTEPPTATVSPTVTPSPSPTVTPAPDDPRIFLPLVSKGS